MFTWSGMFYSLYVSLELITFILEKTKQKQKTRFFIIKCNNFGLNVGLQSIFVIQAGRYNIVLSENIRLQYLGYVLFIFK